MTSKTTEYTHTLPNDETVTFKVKTPLWWGSEGEILVHYPEGVDLSPYRSDEAYPFDAIERDHGTFVGCIANGCDHGQVWEIWKMIEVNANA